MNRHSRRVAFTVFLSASLSGTLAQARGFGGGFHASAGGFHAGGGSYGGFHASGGDFHAAGGSFGGGYGGAYHGSYGGAGFTHTPSYSSAGSFERSGGGYRGYNPYSGASTGGGYRAGSYDGSHGGSVDYAGAGRYATGPYGGGAARGAGAVQVTTPGGRTYTDAGRAGGAVGPGGNAVAGRENVSAASGPRGTAVSGSRGVAASGPGGYAAAGERGGAAYGSYGAAGYHSGAYGAAGYHSGTYGAAGYHSGYYGASAARPYGYNAYGAYHSGWVHGYWNGANSAAWGWHSPYWGGWGMAAAGMGWGLAGWGMGSSLYGMGYMPYANPYYGAVGVGDVGAVATPSPYDYSQPIDTTSAPAPDDVTNQSVSAFDSARQLFYQGTYDQALQQADAAIKQTPNDTALHEFRALCLFALQRYNDSAASLYAVLSVGPGWDWSTLIGLYPNVDVYTGQLRSLEAACTQNTQSASDRFVLAYHYLTQGHNDAAVEILKQIVALRPDDALSAKLLKQLSPSNQTAEASPPATQPTDTTPPQGATIAGNWTANPTSDTAIALNVDQAGKFTWNVTKGGKAQQFSGTSTYGDGLLTLVQNNNGPVLVGRVSWTDASHMTFRIAGDGPSDPGLSFSR